MDSDIFYDDSEVDQRQVDLKLAENEKRKLSKDLYNKGYLDGLEWAENNYALFDIQEIPENLINQLQAVQLNDVDQDQPMNIDEDSEDQNNLKSLNNYTQKPMLEVERLNLRQDFIRSVIEGKQGSIDSQHYMYEAGALNAYLLLSDNRGISMDDEKIQIKDLMERLNINMKNSDFSDQAILQQSHQLREQIDARFN
eukprot:403352794